MMRWKSLPLEGIVGLYFLAYIPNILITKLLTSAPDPTLGRPLTGLETLPASLILNLLLTYLFIWWSGWHRDAKAVRIAGRRVPIPTRYTFLSGIGTALVLFTVPLSFTFQGVSIPFIQLLMRGDILIIAPLVDILFGRRVRWWSWVALVMVLVALAITLQARGELGLPPLAIATVVLYTLGYFIRLAVMTQVSKSGDPASIRKYFVEEKMIALPMSVAALALLGASGLGTQAGELEWGFVGIWSSPALLPIVGIAATLTIVSVFAAIILLDARENSYCVPLERAASLLAGILAAYLLAFGWGLRRPTAAETTGAAILIAAIVLLSVAPRLSRRVNAAQAEAT
ncbi:hypothetical protein [Sphingomonas desiccabilis]|uniref:DMT family transporter n=1 Tax=Sphingomonas desiccabilis TaxID=429134 RepID=A0A4Q2IQY0_9SPHN|nr:hypothetical protein [Sphingomonas desiccabilis]MBB3911186.1 drug/metabolite transporter (DMT)-like permease [Sphingomonas desiccabilis]RXZ32013.1 hypothetical protein EO081_12585 [Sphingomonas desiccabilis]